MKHLLPARTALALFAAAALAGCTPQETADAKNMAEWVSKVATQVEKTASQASSQDCPEGQVCPKSGSGSDAIIPMRDIQEAAVMVKNAAALLATIAGEVEKIPAPFQQRAPQAVAAPGTVAQTAPSGAPIGTPAGAAASAPVFAAPVPAVPVAEQITPHAAPSGDAHTALLAAAQRGDVQAVRRAIAAGAALDRGDERHGNTALILAANHGHTDVVRLLVRSGANLNRSNDSGASALIAAAMSGHTAAASLLIEQGANLNATDNSGNTALMHAKRSGQTAIADMLRAAGANG